MWFKQAQLYQLSNISQYSLAKLTEKLEAFVFNGCLPSAAQSMGWVSPYDETDEGKLIRSLNDYLLFCLQIEEKILPATVIRQELGEAIKQIENSQDRKLRAKEKYALKEDVITSLLPRAFSKLTKVYAYIDIKNKWLVLGTSNAKRIEQFIAMFKKSISEDIESFEIKKLAPQMTSWVKHQNHTNSFAIQKNAVLQDAQQEARVIRCKQQNLSAQAIQSLINDGCDVIQLALTWQDRVHFTLANEFYLTNIQFADEVLDQVKDMQPESKTQQFDADFIIMSEIFAGLFKDLLDMLLKNRSSAMVIPLTKASA